VVSGHGKGERDVIFLIIFNFTTACAEREEE
jgi:hypothetical protein